MCKSAFSLTGLFGTFHATTLFRIYFSFRLLIGRCCSIERHFSCPSDSCNTSAILSPLQSSSYGMLKRSLLSILASLIIVLSVFCQTVSQNSNAGNSPRPLNMLVIGDSILWGQGLKPEHKSWYQVKAWLEKTTGRRVAERIEAHSGTVIELASTDDRLSASNPEVNVALPTINDQLDAAMKSYADASQVDLVLLSGCGNDVGIQNLLNASGTAEINNLTGEKCGAPMEDCFTELLLRFLLL